MSRKRAATDGEREVEERLLELRGGSLWTMKRSKCALFETELGASIHLTHALMPTHTRQRVLARGCWAEVLPSGKCTTAPVVRHSLHPEVFVVLDFKHLIVHLRRHTSVF